jgi:phosphatidylcholine synthase
MIQPHRRRLIPMIARLGAASVHLLTASGAVLALLALRAVHQGDWNMMFVWLGAALIVDAADGPLARKLEVNAVLPRFSGERLDLIVDYLTYVAVPAYALTEAPLLPDQARLPAAAVILLSSLFHVADVESKTEEGYFVGFPAIWNIVLLYLFSLGLPPYVALAVVASFVLATFVPLLAIHPFRVVRLRPLTCLVTLLWAGAATAAVANPFPSPLLVQALLLATALYLAGLGLYRSLV